jgi:peptidoglycan/xylan/chitin deacetylase (PgdA/CDA1 family)
MHPHLGGVGKAVLHASGFYARRLPSVHFPGPAVLCYHGLRAGAAVGQPFEPLHVPVATFEQHCRLIRESCDPIGAADLLAALSLGAPLPPRAVLVTFDDGYRSVLTLAKPILERYRIPAVVFACSAPIERGSLFWYDAVARARGEGEVQRLKSVPFDDWRTSTEPFDVRVAADDAYAPLSVEDLRSLAATPGIEIGGHTAEHPILARASGDEQTRQVFDDKRALESWTDRPVRLFSYPNGRPQIDYTAATSAIVRRCGYEAAFTTESAYVSASGDRYEVPRFMMLASISAAALAHRFTFGWLSKR